jgi:prepilin-type processing-associated H-X9-DG protein
MREDRTPAQNTPLPFLIKFLGIADATGEDVKQCSYLGFGRIEVVIASAAIGFIVVGILLPNIQRPKPRGARIQCVSNLKQVGLGFRMWANDHQDRFPWEVPVAEGGTKELTNLPYPALHFLAASNEFNSPKILVCPEDKSRIRTNVWIGLWQHNVSYFVGLDANEELPATLLSGDRDVSANGKSVTGLLTISDPNKVKWAGDIHKLAGNIGFADGSVTQCTSDDLKRAVRSALEQNTNGFLRLSIP